MSQFLNALGGVGVDGSVSAANIVALSLIDMAIKSFLLLTVIWVAACLLRKYSAATVHRLWTLGFFGCLLIPVISLVAPTWNLPILPTPASMLTTQNDRAAESQPGSSGVEQPLSPASHGVPVTARTTGLAKLPGASGRGQTAAMPIDGGAAKVVLSESDLAAGLSPPLTDVSAQAKTSRVRSWILACLTCWIGGVLVCLLRTVWHRLSLARILNRCKSIDGEAWKSAAAHASRSLGLNRTVRLLKLEDALSPMIAGIFQPVVVLPGDADVWLPAKRRSVLLHELAHAKRYDVLSQAAAGLVCALHWFNPICWYGLSQMRKLRELACDDLVVASGYQPADYADVLLDVARTYRHRHPMMAVGMARGANVEGRILATLDRARSHVAVSRRAARIFLASSAALAVLIGSMRLESQAEQSAVSPASDGETLVEEGSEKEKVEPDNILRPMEIRITDEKGQPIEKAKLFINVLYLKGYNDVKAPKVQFTNADGIVTLKLPRRVRTLQLWSSKPSYVPEYFKFSKGTHDEDVLIPDRYEFQLAEGTELGGTVVDESGEPISGVKVRVKVEVDQPAWATSPESMISTWLTATNASWGPAYTDKDGKWRINTAPAQSGRKDFEFRLKFSRQDYTSDSEWGELQKDQKLTTEMLRNGTAKLVLSRGTRLSGTVVDSAGNPVTQGSVIWRDDPFGNAKKFETKLDEAGRFETDPLPPGEHTITIIAPSHQPERRTVTVTKAISDVQFKLQPGKRLRVKVVDVDGNPIPKARFQVESWRSTRSEIIGGPSGVFEGRFPHRADDQGIYVWDGAPADGVTYRISARGFSSDTVTLVANDTEHIVKLLPLLVATGQVTDAKTGEPIKEFRVVPVTVFRPKFLSTNFQNEVEGRDGKYELNLAGDAEYDYRYQVRIDADGYRSAIGAKSFELVDGRVTQDFALEPVAARTGKVIGGQGRPVASASVVQGTPSSVPSIRNAKLGRGERRIETSSDGQFQLAATFEPVRIRVTHESGFAEVLRQPDEAIGTIQLQPWARVSGRLLQDGIPIPNQSMYFNPVPSGQLGEPRFQDSYSTKTDAEGRFEFERLPPITGTLRASLGPWRDSPLTSSHTLPLSLKPGEHRQITLGGDGIAVTGRVIATGRGDAELNKNWSLNYLISRDRGIELPVGFPGLSFDPTGPVQSSWFLEPKHYDWLATRENFFVKLQPDGQLHISGVPPGTYDLVLRLYEQPAGCLVETIGEKVVTIEITESDAALGTKDIGVIEVECRAGPRVGENMQLYTFTDTNGRQRSIQDMKGRHVLMHVWASWCAPCLENMPEMKAMITQLSDRPITFVGLNVDRDASQAKVLAERGGWNWSQNYLGDSSDVARQLAISSVPTYYLIGPDGLLIASSTEWSEMEERLGGLLQGKQSTRQ